MFFEVLNRFGRIPSNAKSQVFLTWDDWNDYSFHTLFGIFYVNEDKEKIDLGSVKIGHYGQKIIDRGLKIGDTFDEIGEDFFSVGQDDSYYRTINKLGAQIRDKILVGLNDIAKNSKIYEKAIKEEVTKISLLRDVSPLSVTGQFRRLSKGGARLTNYNFEFATPASEGVTPMTLSFDVTADSNPPTNIHILIGRNGVGKTHLIHNMVNSLMKDDQQINYGKFSQRKRGRLFANLICVTFSAFDNFDHPEEKMDKSVGINYNYIGLKEVKTESKTTLLKNPDLLKGQFLKSLISCRNNSRMIRWKSAIQELETDPIFREADITQLADIENGTTLKRSGDAIFERLSSGHKIILLTITRLVETLQERSLVLIDEPEAHLHPPLLSSFTRSLSELLIDTNAVSIIATHSPVVLQEVPRSCVWKLQRSGDEAKVERLEIESFGENVGVLTQEVFGLEVTDSGFHSILKKAVENRTTFDAAIRYLDNSVGLEGKAILRSLFYQKYAGDEENQ